MQFLNLQMRGQYSTTIDMLIIELDQQFMNSELMNAIGIMYPQFWIQLDVDLSFFLHMVVIKKHYYDAKRVKPLLL